MVEKLKQIIIKAAAEKGDIVLFMLLKEVAEIDKWSVVISAPWMDSLAQSVPLDYWITLLRKSLDQQESSQISKVSVLNTKDPFVQSVIGSMNISGGSVNLTNGHIGSYLVNEAIIFEAKAVSSDSRASFSRKNPNLDNRINPNFNNRINPNFNSRINPNLNSRINPNFNNRINPNLNSRINPNFNNRINPNFNSRINPNFNNRINPNFNSRINPSLNSTFDGLVMFDLNLTKLAYFVISGENIISMFDFSNNYSGFAVKSSTNQYNVFDLSNTWIGYMASNKDTGYNYFDTKGKWLGFML